LKQQVKYEILAIAPREESISKFAYEEIIRTSYEKVQKALEQQGVDMAFSKLNKQVLNQILKSKFYGSNYSQHIYSNVKDFSKELQEILGSSLSTGKSYAKTSKIIQDRFKVSKSNATRLVRTETSYFHNQAELQSYIDDGIEEYEYDAHLDGRTSQICRDLNRHKFKVKNAQTGENYPPMHPHCRSTTQVILK